MRLGVLLLLLGLFTGLLVPNVPNPRMALASHMEGVMSGIMLMVMGLIWSRVRLGEKAMKAACWLLVYGAYANWLNTLLGAVWAAGGSMMPMASMGRRGSPIQEAIIGFLSVTLALALLSGMSLVLWGLRGGAEPEGADNG
jgi:hydroxylaminobenzene mutase